MKKALLATTALLLATSAFAQTSGPPSGGGGGSGVTSIATSGGIAPNAGTCGGTLSTAGSLVGQTCVNSQTGTSYTFTNADNGKLVTFNNGGLQSITLPQAGVGGQFLAGWRVEVESLGVGSVVISASTSTLDGSASLGLNKNQGFVIVSDGTNYFTERGAGLTGNQTVTLTGDASGSGATSIATTIGKVNGGSIPLSATALASNASNQIVAATVQGNGSKVQLSTGTTTTDHCAKFDANGNTVDFGAGCGGGGGGITGPGTTVNLAIPQWSGTTGSALGAGLPVTQSGAASSLTETDANSNLTLNGLASQNGASVTVGGAKCDGTTDDTTAINTYLATFSAGGIVYVPFGKQCLINTGNLVIPSGVVLVGIGSPMPPATNAQPTGSAILLNPLYTIQMGANSALKQLAVLRSGLVANPTATQAAAAVATWCGERSYAITIPANIGGVSLRDLFIEGFNTAFVSYAGQYHAEYIAGDDCNGVEQSGGGDNLYLDQVRFEPYYSLATSPIDTHFPWDRPGIAFHIHDGITGWFCNRCFAFGWQNAVTLADVGIGSVVDSVFEWQRPYSARTSTTYGIRLVGHNAGVSLQHDQLNSYLISVADEPTGGGELMASEMSPLPDTTNGITGFYLGGTPATPPSFTLTGTPLAGRTISLTLTAAGIAGSPVTVTYTLVTGDTINSALKGLKNVILHNAALQTAHVGATLVLTNTTDPSTSTSISVLAPQALSLGVTAGSVGMTMSAATFTAGLSGSLGLISNTNASAMNHTQPVFTIAPNPFAIFINGLFTGDNILPANWISFSGTNGTNQVKFNGIRYSPLGNSNISGCGTTPQAGNGIGTDAKGTVTEGTTASGCTLTFSTPWPAVPPDCMVIGQNGLQITGYAVTQTTLTVTNPTGTNGQFSYRCEW